jgi:hypothetical protein
MGCRGRKSISALLAFAFALAATSARAQDPACPVGADADTIVRQASIKGMALSAAMNRDYAEIVLKTGVPFSGLVLPSKSLDVVQLRLPDGTIRPIGVAAIQRFELLEVPKPDGRGSPVVLLTQRKQPRPASAHADKWVVEPIDAHDPPIDPNDPSVVPLTRRKHPQPAEAQAPYADYSETEGTANAPVLKYPTTKNLKPREPEASRAPTPRRRLKDTQEMRPEDMPTDPHLRETVKMSEKELDDYRSATGQNDHYYDSYEVVGLDKPTQAAVDHNHDIVTGDAVQDMWTEQMYADPKLKVVSLDIAYDKDGNIVASGERRRFAKDVRDKIKSGEYGEGKYSYRTDRYDLRGSPEADRKRFKYYSRNPRQESPRQQKVMRALENQLNLEYRAKVAAHSHSKLHPAPEYSMTRAAKSKWLDDEITTLRSKAPEYRRNDPWKAREMMNQARKLEELRKKGCL